MKIKIFLISVLLFFSTNHVYSSEKSIATRQLKKKAYEYFQNGEYSLSIPYIERYLEIQPAEIYMRLVYANALLYKEDLPIPTRDEDSYSRSQKWKEIRSNYKESAAIFEINIAKLEMVRPRDPALGKWYYQWAMAEWFSGNKEKALKLFQKSVKKDFTLIDSYYNMGAIYESMGQYADAEKAWRNYVQAEKELNVED
ncbi:MAG: tetratricopeptide repeat protein [Leptospira sp.]|nr:tetratricopeptide repeat protein [Leptospira sp.]